MASLKHIQSKIPSAASVAGRVIALHEGKHVDLGEYVGDDAVALSTAGADLLASLTNAAEKRDSARDKRDDSRDNRDGRDVVSRRDARAAAVDDDSRYDRAGRKDLTMAVKDGNKPDDDRLGSELGLSDKERRDASDVAARRDTRATAVDDDSYYDRAHRKNLTMAVKDGNKPDDIPELKGLPF